MLLNDYIQIIIKCNDVNNSNHDGNILIYRKLSLLSTIITSNKYTWEDVYMSFINVCIKLNHF